MYCREFITLIISLTALPAAAQSDFTNEREAMVEQVVRLAELTGGETGRPRFADNVIDAMRIVPRHEFVPGQSRNATAYSM